MKHWTQIGRHSSARKYGKKNRWTRAGTCTHAGTPHGGKWRCFEGSKVEGFRHLSMDVDMVCRSWFKLLISSAMQA